MSYLIQNRYFGITMSAVHLLRSGYSYKEIPNESIIKISLKKGIRTKYPARTAILGAASLVISFLMIQKGIDPMYLFLRDPSSVSYRLVLVWLMFLGFLVFLGISSFVWLLKKEFILEIITSSGRREVFMIKKLSNENKPEDLQKICAQLFGSAFQNKI